MKKLSTLGMIIGASLVCAIPVSLHWSPAKAPQLSVDGAQARIGRPLMPFSVAGVHRRMYRPGAYGAYAYGGNYGYHHGGYYGYHRPYYAYGGYHRPYYAYGGYYRPRY